MAVNGGETVVGPRRVGGKEGRKEGQREVEVWRGQMLRGGKVVALSSVVEIIKGDAWFGSTVVTGWREGKFLMVLQGARRGGGWTCLLSA